MARRIDWYRWAVLAGLLAMVVLGFVLLGCAREAGAVPDSMRPRFEEEGGGAAKVTVVTDHDTGVQYLVTDKGGITPLLSSDGTPYVGGEVLG